MSHLEQTEILGAVEGLVDEAVLRRLVGFVGARLGAAHVKNGKPNLLKNLKGYNRAAIHVPWVVLIDLDQDASCAASAVLDWLREPAPFMCFRVAVRSVEAWLLADQERIASFLGIHQARIPRDPDAEDNPKRLLVDIASHSRHRRIREGMVPRPASGRMVGPLYVSLMIEFINEHWSPEDAVNYSDSLKRCCVRLNALAAV